MDNSKGALIEKIMFALIPILFTCIAYLISSLNDANHRLTILEAKFQDSVTSDALHEMNNRLDVAREKLKQDFLNLQTENIQRHSENRGILNTLEWRITQLEKEKH